MYGMEVYKIVENLGKLVECGGRPQTYSTHNQIQFLLSALPNHLSASEVPLSLRKKAYYFLH